MYGSQVFEKWHKFPFSSNGFWLNDYIVSPETEFFLIHWAWQMTASGPNIFVLIYISQVSYLHIFIPKEP